MPIIELDTNTALVVIDLQKGITGFPLVHPITEIIAHTQSLARAFRTRNLPVVLVNVNGGAPGRTDAGHPKFAFPPDWADLVPELEQQDSDILVTKKTWGAFHQTDLDSQLRQRGVTQIVLTGVATSIGVESTARFAYEYGYNVALVTDAMTDMNADAHQNSIDRIFPRLGETGDTERLLKLLAAI